MKAFVLGSNLSVLPFSTCAELPQIRTCFKLGLRPVHSSVGAVGIDLDGTKFRMYAVVSRASLRMN